MPEVAAELREIVNREIPRLNALSGNRAKSPIAPGKWSPQEIIGHLIDSASNNHGRFVQAQLMDDLTFPGLRGASGAPPRADL